MIIYSTLHLHHAAISQLAFRSFDDPKGASTHCQQVYFIVVRSFGAR